MQVSSDLREVARPSWVTGKVGEPLSTSALTNLPVPPNPGSETELEDWPVYLHELGLIKNTSVEATLLSTGQSGRVISVEDLVIKCAHRLLDTGTDWLANPYRTAAEGTALRRVATTYPNLVPHVHHIDEPNAVIILSKEPGVTVKSQLFAGSLETISVTAIVEALEIVHSLPAERLDGLERFMTLRLSPYYLRAAATKPAFAEPIKEVVDRLRQTHTHFVHGDFCPKNILVDPQSPEILTLLDWEAAHLGDPAFDYAFFLTHLIAKLHVKEELEGSLSLAINLILSSYLRTVSDDLEWLTQLTGATILARCWGASKLEYLDEATHAALSEFGAALLVGDTDLGEIL